MTPRPGHGRKGSVILMAVGILVLLAMAGTTFLIVSHLDNRESYSIQLSAPVKNVPQGMLTKAATTIGEDLRFNAVGPSQCPYEAATTWMQQVDHASEAGDPWLASTCTTTDGAGTDVWVHLSNFFGTGDAVLYENVPAVVDSTPDTPVSRAVGAGTHWYVDADGDRVIDSLLVDTKVRDAQGAWYFAGMRAFDLSGQVNANTAYGPQTVVPFDKPYTEADGGTRGMSVVDVDWTGLGYTAADRDALHAERCRMRLGATPPAPPIYWSKYARSVHYALGYGGSQTYWPTFSPEDALAMLWRETNLNKTTCTARGRLMSVLGAGNLSVRRFVCVYSASRLLPLQIPGEEPPTVPAAYWRYDQTRQVDLNTAEFQELYEAAYNAIAPGVNHLTDGALAEQDAKRRRLAAQLAVNIIDFRDSDDDVTVKDVPLSSPVEKVYGVERQPFITEAFHKRVYGDGTPEGETIYSAIELFNPYETSVDIRGLKVRVGSGSPQTITGLPADGLPAGGRAVLVKTDVAGAIPVHADTPAARVFQVAGLDVGKGVQLLRTRDSAGATGTADVILGEVSFTAAAPTVGNTVQCSYRQWDDSRDRARYALGDLHVSGTTRDYTAAQGGSMTAGATNLGTANNLAADAVDGKPTPVYVRNDKFVSLGELCRIFHVGPGTERSGVALSLPGWLGNGDTDGDGTPDVAHGRLDPLGATSATASADVVPPIPPACLMTQFFTVTNPAADTFDQNRREGADDDEEVIVYGRININTAPREVLLCLPFLKDHPEIVDRILADRAAKPAARPAFASVGEVMASIMNLEKDSPGAGKSNAYPPSYKIADDGSTDDGLGEVNDDLSKLLAHYRRLSNVITVRSDTFAVYITVMRFRGSDASANDLGEPNAIRRYVAVVDRSECFQRGNAPRVYMFAEIR